MTIREAASSDTKAVAEVINSAWNSTHSGILSDKFLAEHDYIFCEKRWKNILSGESKQKESVFVCLNDNNEIIGVASCAKIQDDPDYDGEIKALYILKDYQHIGYGRQLFNAAA